MAQSASMELKAPKTFEDIQKLINEYNYSQQLIKKAEDGTKVLLGFVGTNSDTPGVNYETLDYTWGQVFANCLKERCVKIKELIENRNW